jgi:dihydropteroate synthase
VSERIWRCRDHRIPLGERTLVMGVVNVTPDSFSDGGLFADTETAVAHAARLVDDGADIVDIGGESTRPGAEPVPVKEELRRVVPVIEGVRAARPGVPISVDTRHADVAAAAIEGGASIVNDVAGGADHEMLSLAADGKTGMVLMHMRGEPGSMQQHPTYDDVVADVHEFLRERVEAALFAGLASEQLCVDPGVGFGKTVEHNLALLRSLGRFRDLEAGLLVGVSRKRFIGALTGVEDPTDRLEGSLAGAVLAAAAGVDVVRVHAVGATVRAMQVTDAVTRPR